MFQLNQVFINPRTNEPFMTVYDEYETLAEAKKAARTDLKGSKWAIVESKIVARSE